MMPKHPLSNELRKLAFDLPRLKATNGDEDFHLAAIYLRRAADALDLAKRSEHDVHNRLDIVATERDQMRAIVKAAFKVPKSKRSHDAGCRCWACELEYAIAVWNDEKK